MVRYKVKPERLEEHVRYIHAVFEELSKTAPAGIRYGAFKQPDGLSFVHVAFIEGEANPLDALAAFKAFVERVKERCDEPPTTIALTTVGAYGF
jgi:metal-dependent amidase/aminoacylase/carboxypeptidase family protein